MTALFLQSVPATSAQHFSSLNGVRQRKRSGRG